jgi:hypothetical protein
MALVRHLAVSRRVLARIFNGEVQYYDTRESRRGWHDVPAAKIEMLEAELA